MRQNDTLVPFAGRAADETPAGLERRIATQLRRTARIAVTSVLEGTVTGAATSVPDAPDGALLAYGDPARPGDLGPSFSAARRALEACWAFGRTGHVTLAALGPLTGVHADPATGEALTRDIIAPLHKLPRGGPELERTLGG